MSGFSEKYGAFFTKEYMMGPNALRLLDEMLGRYPLETKGRVLDLGCGTGLSSMFLAKETGAQVFAVDLWCSATDNYRRFCRWNVGENTVPVHADHNGIFAHGMRRKIPVCDHQTVAVTHLTQDLEQFGG